VSRPTVEAEGRRTKNIMKRICIISLFILLASCAPTQTEVPTQQPTGLTLDTPPACQSLQQGLCIVSEPGESLGGGKTTVIAQNPVAAFLGQSTALQVKVGEWTLVFDPGENVPFSVGMTFPDAHLYPQGKNPGMTMEDNGKKCDTVEGYFTDDFLLSAQNANSLNTNPVTSFDIRFAMQCNGETQVIHGRVVLQPK
jgi:hypothetical protein